MQTGAARDLERMAREGLEKAGLELRSIRTFAGPRRLTLVVDGLPVAQPDRTDERKGPRTTAPEAALAGFLRSTGLTRDKLIERDGVFVATLSTVGRITSEIIADLVPDVVRRFPWPKSMTWGSGSLRWVRPLHRILCVFDGEIVPFEIDGIVSGDITDGHRVMAAGRVVKARTFADYRQLLTQAFVVLESAERVERIAADARALAEERGLSPVEDRALLEEVAGMVEWPVALLGRHGRALPYSSARGHPHHYADAPALLRHARARRRAGPALYCRRQPRDTGRWRPDRQGQQPCPGGPLG